MHRSRVVLTLGLVMLTAAVAAAQKVTTDYEKSADFDTYQTFMWIKDPITNNPVMQQGIVDGVNAALTGRGLQLATENADMGIAVHCATREQRTLDTFYDGVGGGWRWRGGFPSATTTVTTYEVGTLVIDVFD